MKNMPPTDVVIVGGGFTGLLLAKEIGQRTSHTVTILERGGPREAKDYAGAMDELDYNVRFKMMQDYSMETVTLRYTPKDRAIPVRQLGSFMPGTGVGGAAEHWGAQIPRQLPDTFELLSSTTAKYGAKKLPEGHSIVDWGIGWNEIEPYYTRMDKLLGCSGKAGNIKGKKDPAGNIFEGPRSEEYPTPPTKTPYFASLFHDAAKSVGYHPFPNACAMLSTAYTNPDGITRPGCVYCGFCDRFGCMIEAKAQPTNVLLPVVKKQQKVTMRTGMSVRRVLFDAKAQRATGVTYVDATGEEYFQPADVVILASWILNNTRLLLLSKIGEPYDPVTGKGAVGKNLTHQISFTAAQVFFDTPLNRFMGAAGAGVRMTDLDGDVFDHSNLNFIRGGSLAGIGTGFQPIVGFGTLPPSVKARWGAEWKKQAVYYYDRWGAIGFSGEHTPYRDHFMDLDASYKDHWGDPLLRLTIDWRDNERNMIKYVTEKAVEIGRAMKGAKEVSGWPGYGHYDTTRYQSTHVQGGAIMGPSPEGSVVNTYGQHWQLSNLFITGAATFPNQGSGNPTPTVLAMAFRTADGLCDRYFKKPGSLV